VVSFIGDKGRQWHIASLPKFYGCEFLFLCRWMFSDDLHVANSYAYYPKTRRFDDVLVAGGRSNPPEELPRSDR